MAEPVYADSTDGVTLALYDLGGSGPPVLFAHATGFCGESLAPMAAALNDAHCWALDFRAHGRSSRPADGNLAWEGVGADVLAAIDHLGLDRPFGVGHSMGGAGLILAELARPGAFCGIWAFEPIVIPPAYAVEDDNGNFLAESAARRRPGFASMDVARANFASKPPMATFDPRALEGYLAGGFEPADDGSVALRCTPDDESTFYRMGARHGAWDRLGNLDVPNWIVQGSVDVAGPATFAPLIAERIPGARLVAHPELGHFGPFEQPELLATEVDRARSEI